MTTIEPMVKTVSLDVPASQRFTAHWLHLAEEELHKARMELYHSTGEGYHIYRGFIEPDLVEHMRTIWSTIDPTKTHRPWEGNHNAYPGCPDYHVQYEDGGRVFYNFLFSAPVDEVTREVSICVHMLRNRLSGRNAFSDLNGPYSAVSYRITHNKNYGKWSPLHNDFLDYEKRFEKGSYDPSRLQATLFLSEWGKDYQGEGFKFQTNSGRQIVFGRDVPIKAGDLVIWKYTNFHGVENVVTPEGKFGFMRIIYPIHLMTPQHYTDLIKQDLARLAKKANQKARNRLKRLIKR